MFNTLKAPLPKKLPFILALLIASSVLFAADHASSQTTQEEQPETSAPEVPASQENLTQQFSYEQSWFEQGLPQKTAYLAKLKASLDATPQTVEGNQESTLILKGAAQVISDQISTTKRRKDKINLTLKLSDNLTQQAYLTAQNQAQVEARQNLSSEVNAVEAYIKDYQSNLEQIAQAELQRQKAEEEKRLEEERQRLEAAKLKRKAEADLEKIKDRQRQATTEQIKDLLGTQQTLAERVITLTDDYSALQKEIAQLNELNQKSFAQLRDEAALFIDQLPSPEQTLKKAQQSTADKLFDQLHKEQRRARDAFLDTRAQMRELSAEFEVAQNSQDEADEKLQDAIAAHKESSSELSEARQELATTRAKLSRLETQLVQLRLEDVRQKHAFHDQELTIYYKDIETLLHYISSSKRAQFYSLSNEQNWQDARQNTRLAIVRVQEHAAIKFSQFLEVLSNPFSIRLWSWLGGLILHLAVVFAGVYVVTSRGPNAVKRVMGYLLKRAIFRKYPTLTLKVGRALRNLLPLMARYLGWLYIISYVQGVLPEAKYFLWLINAIFIFRAVTITTSSVVMPRQKNTPDDSQPQESNHLWDNASPQPDNTDTDDSATSPEDVVLATPRDLSRQEFSRAKKFVRSARVITLFWLLVIYIPSLTVVFLGHTVIWRVADLAATWGFILVLYSVLSTWKDDIARLFEKLASERLPRAVQFVNENKDRIWGVLVIGLASLYVLAREITRISKRYLIETEWSKQINNFIFRKQIEYKQRDRDKFAAQTAQEIPNPLPPDYIELFENHPLCDEIYNVEHGLQIKEDILTHYDGWNSTHTQGSIAVHGESGVGRSTLLHQLAMELQERCEEDNIQLVYTRMIERVTSQTNTLNYIAQLFEIEPVATRAELIEKINQLPPHVLLIDDCQRLYLRTIGGFAGLECFLQVVNLTDTKHFWVLTIEHFAWGYLARIKQRAHYFGQVLELPLWTDSQIQDLIWKRNLVAGKTTNFTNLVVTHEEANDDVSFEVIKSAQGYFRLLHDFCKGNPRVALLYWLRSLKINEQDEQVLDVGLFQSPPQKPLAALQDNYWFTLTAIAQHGALNSKEISHIINADEGFCEMALNYFEEKNIVSLDSQARAKLTSIYMRQIIKQLTISNYLYD